jgi:hypothetical protein
MIKTKACLFSFFFFFFIFSIPASAQIELVRGTAYEVALKNSMERLDVPVELTKEAKDKKLVIQLLSVHMTGQVDNLVINSFNGITLFDTLGNTYLRLPIHSTSALKTGIYNLLLRVKDSNDLITVLQKLTITLAVKPAVVPTPATVVINRTDPGPWFPYEVIKAPLNFWETGGNALVKPAAVRQLRLVDAQGQPVPGKFWFKDSTEIPAGGDSLFDYELSGDFPIGKVTGTFQLVGPQLATPVPVTFEITTKRGWIWLIFAILVGLLVGYLFRTLLQNTINKNLAKLKIAELMRYISLVRIKWPDENFGNETDEIIRRLNTALRETDPAKITTAVNNEETLLRTAVEKLIREQGEAQTRLVELEDLIRPGTWSLPEVFEDLLNGARITLQSAMKLNTTGNVSSAATMLSEIKIALPTQLRATMEQYRTDAMRAVTFLKGSVYKEAVSWVLLDQVHAAAERLPIAEPNVTTEVLLKAVHDLNYTVSNFKSQLGTQMALTFQTLFGRFQSAGVKLADPDAMNALLEEVHNITARLGQPARGNWSLLKELPDVLKNLYRVLSSALFGQTAFTSEDPEIEARNKVLRTAIGDNLGNGNYLVAGEKTIEFLQLNPTSVKTLSTSPMNLDRILFIPTASITDKTAMFTTNPPIQVPSYPDTLYQQVYRKLKVARFWEFVLSSIFITFIGYLIHSPTFVGTLDQMSSIFFWAFTLDISLATVLTLMPRVVRS